MKCVDNNEIENWFHELDCLERADKCQAPHFIKPFHLATLAHRLRLRRLSGLTLPSKIAGYANVMNLWGALKIEPPAEINHRSPGGRYFPVTLLCDETTTEQTADDLVELFKPVCSDATTIDAVHTMLRELVGNCYAHAEVEDGVFGVICAQAWPAGRKAQIAIADTGIGIRESLLQNPALVETVKISNSCELATQYGITSKPGKGHSGYGLAVARKLMEQNSGTLVVRSGNEAFCMGPRRLQQVNTKCVWHGTLLVIEWDLDVPMNIRDVYDSFPLPEGMTDDDFDF